jgi:hypothetical protein
MTGPYEAAFQLIYEKHVALLPEPLRAKAPSLYVQAYKHGFMLRLGIPVLAGIGILAPISHRVFE